MIDYRYALVANISTLAMVYFRFVILILLCVRFIFVASITRFFFLDSVYKVRIHAVRKRHAERRIVSAKPRYSMRSTSPAVRFTPNEEREVVKSLADSRDNPRENASAT